MPKTRSKTQLSQSSQFSLEQAHTYFDTLANAANSKANWKNALTTLINYNESQLNTYQTDMTKAELFEKYKEVDIVPLINDYDKVSDIVDSKLLSSVSKQPLALDSIKQTYLAIIRLTQKKSPFQIDKKLREKNK
jgi:hypothetical protein